MSNAPLWFKPTIGKNLDFLFLKKKKVVPHVKKKKNKLGLFVY